MENEGLPNLTCRYCSGQLFSVADQKAGEAVAVTCKTAGCTGNVKPIRGPLHLTAAASQKDESGFLFTVLMNGRQPTQAELGLVTQQIAAGADVESALIELVTAGDAFYASPMDRERIKSLQEWLDVGRSLLAKLSIQRNGR